MIKKNYFKTKITIEHIDIVGLALSPCKRSEQGGSKFSERKNPHTLVYGVKGFVCLSVRL